MARATMRHCGARWWSIVVLSFTLFCGGSIDVKAEKWWPFNQLEKGKATPSQPMEVRETSQSATPQATSTERASFGNVVKEVVPAVVSVFVVRSQPPDMGKGFQISPGMVLSMEGLSSQGSGVIVREDGTILTSARLVGGAEEISVVLPDSRDRIEATLVGKDDKTDVALLKIETSRELPVVKFGDSRALEVGDVVIAVGNPFNVGQTISAGIVSAMGRSDVGLYDIEEFIQTDASLHPGHAGGALVNMKGELVGINSAPLSFTGDSMGIGFAVPAHMAVAVMEQIVKHGRVKRGFLGVRIQPLTKELQEAFSLPSDEGALVNEVTQGSPAEKAGLKVGDVIVDVSGEAVKDHRHLVRIVSEKEPGVQVEVALYRGGERMSMKAQLEDLPRPQAVEEASVKKAEERRPNEFLPGAVLGELTDELRGAAGVPREIKGVMITDLQMNSVASRADLRPGDLIVEINNKSIATVESAKVELKKAAGGQALLKIWNRGGHRYAAVKIAK